MRVGVTPVPIPNTMVKTDAADNTWLETAREDRCCRIYKRVLLLSMIRSKNKHSWMAWSIRPEVSKIQDIVSETRMYLENFIQELR